MYVSDFSHLPGIGDDAPAPARRMAGHLAAVVRAATSSGTGEAWVSGIACGRRPGRRPCPGRISVHRNDVPPTIRWECTACGDDGVIVGWEDSHADLRSAPGAPGRGPVTLLVPFGAVDLLQSLLFLDSAMEKLVWGGRAAPGGVVLSGTADVVDQLVDTVAAEATHEPNRRRRIQLDALCTVLTGAVGTPEVDRAAVVAPVGRPRIRVATVADLGSVLDLWRQADAEPTRTDDLPGLVGLLQRDPSALLVADAAGDIVGSVVGGWDGWRGTIHRLAVAPAHRRQGLASALVDAAEARLRALGAVRLQAIVVVGSPDALGFWDAAGWERQSDRARFVKG